jgi:hypothetical protein
MWFFDLEATLIESWDNPVIVNRSKVGEIMSRPDFDHNITIFSWAIWDQRDLQIAQRNIYPMLEEVFGLNVVNTITRDQLFKIVKEKWFWLDEEDFGDMFDKERAFIEFCRLSKLTGNQYLVDDMVLDMKLVQENIDIEMIKV